MCPTTPKFNPCVLFLAGKGTKQGYLIRTKAITNHQDEAMKHTALKQFGIFTFTFIGYGFIYAAFLYWWPYDLIASILTEIKKPESYLFHTHIFHAAVPILVIIYAYLKAFKKYTPTNITILIISMLLSNMLIDFSCIQQTCYNTPITNVFSFYTVKQLITLALICIIIVLDDLTLKQKNGPKLNLEAIHTGYIKCRPEGSKYKDYSTQLGMTIPLEMQPYKSKPFFSLPKPSLPVKFRDHFMMLYLIRYLGLVFCLLLAFQALNKDAPFYPVVPITLAAPLLLHLISLIAGRSLPFQCAYCSKRGTFVGYSWLFEHKYTCKECGRKWRSIFKDNIFKVIKRGFLVISKPD